MSLHCGPSNCSSWVSASCFSWSLSSSVLSTSYRKTRSCKAAPGSDAGGWALINGHSPGPGDDNPSREADEQAVLHDSGKGLDLCGQDRRIGDRGPMAIEDKIAAVGKVGVLGGRGRAGRGRVQGAEL